MNTLEHIQIDTATQQLVHSEVAHRYGIIPKEQTKSALHCYAIDGDNKQINNELAMLFGAPVILEQVPEGLIKQALSKYYRLSKSGQNKSDFVMGNDFLENLIHDAKATDSSDIHFEIYKKQARIRFRMDGRLVERYAVKEEQYAELINKIKIKARLNITERRLPQDGRIQYDAFDIRVSVLPTLYGEKVVMRLLGKDTSHLSMDSLGMQAAEQLHYLEAAKASKGIILISGPTGSGKTTTLYATLKLLNKIDRNIVTIEDPIEYTLDGINQVQLKEDIGLTFTAALKSFLRQDPDVIMLGEIRDEKTAQMAIRASLTGHLVLSTIHTNSAVGTLSRLIDMGIPPFLLSETLKISVAQRLVRKLCPDCKEQKPLEKESRGHGLLSQVESHFVPVGCDSCYYTGYKGRIAVYECIPITAEVKKLLKQNDIAGVAKHPDSSYEPISHKALELIRSGKTSVAEVYALLID
ncbi:MAG: GspE/PulE family protein [Gilvibacter sp.]